MSALIVECPRDRKLFAELETVDGEVLVRVCRRAGGLDRGGPDMNRILGSATFDAPLHLVRDGVHAMLLDLHRGEVR